MKNSASYRYILFLLILITPIFFCFGCATPPNEHAADWEPWAGELNGMVDADLELFFARYDEAQNVYLVKGNFEGEIEKIAGRYGSGTMKGIINGKVKDGIINIRLRGWVTVSDCIATAEGKMNGVLSKTQASGTWKIEASDNEDTYNFLGDWNARKVSSESQGN